MLNHINEAKNIYFSQRVLTYILINCKDVTREEIYDKVQSITLKCLKDKLDFKDEVLQSSLIEYVSKEQLESLFDNNFFLRHVDRIFNRVFK
ncbi:hypothetical protein JIY74_34330 [Vibrio harveyi]|nr:hypothetical protein [Vibrio harveyi]